MKFKFSRGKRFFFHGFKAAIILTLTLLLSGAVLIGCDPDVDCDCDGCRACAGGYDFVTLFERQEEAQANLEEIYQLQVSYFGEYNTYSHSYFGWSPRWGTRYAYFIDGDSVQPDLGGPYHLPAWIGPKTGQYGFTAVAVGNIDCDATLDVWTINAQERLINHVNDITQ